ncbi:type I-E CRISPR-associated protein Cas5/CasD [Methanofollis formosanus]|uniref:Type I-E CRISPR-associated protein Cas5/CasD n=1 Tax=Methanofollis formosanus TaxID=299308 RepID=A0A8G1A471_9EURY|nr:type I-E CRISPR-associated protein Cas5/CasD [Methanofollis formosanus]QYZ80141.1 type I-E CRISPR-associated protein Cas5/CasD [Methanofollis formosanus]
MPEYLLFRLFGPMAAWGGMAVGEYRPAESHPSRSAVFGLVAAALGIRREEAALLRRLQEGYRMAVLVNASGNLIRDYHTTQVPSETTKKRAWPFATRREEVSVPRESLNTILSTREYFCDALYTVCLWPADDAPPYPLSALAEALRSPAFVPYLGRKSCPVTIPLQPQVIGGDNLRAAMDAAAFQDQNLLRSISRKGKGMLFWEGEDDMGFEIESRQTVPRRDVSLDRRQWQFTERKEHGALVQVPEGVR